MCERRLKMESIDSYYCKKTADNTFHKEQNKKQKQTGNRKNIIKSVMMTAFLSVVLFCSSITVCAAGKAGGETVRVVLVNYLDTGYVELAGDEVTGYYVDYLDEIARYTGWKYQFQVVSEEDALLDVVQRGDYDLLIGVSYTKEDAENYFEYPVSPIGAKKLVLATQSSSYEAGSILRENLYKGVKVGITDSDYGSMVSQRFEKYCDAQGILYGTAGQRDFDANQGITLRTVTLNQRMEDLKQGKVDALLLADSVALENDLYVIESFGQEPFYAVAPKGDRHLVDDLDAVISTIESQDAAFQERLYEKYFSDTKQHTITFDEREEAFLKEGHEYAVALLRNYAPYQYLDTDGNWRGVAVEILKKISDMTGGRITFQIKGYNSEEEEKDALREGEVDLLGSSFFGIGSQLSRQSHIYDIDTISIYRNKDFYEEIKDAKIVVMEHFPDSALKEYGLSNLDRVIRVPTVVDALRMVNTGGADVTFMLQNVADYYISYYQMEHISSVTAAGSTVSFCLMYGDEMGNEEMQLLNRCLTYLDADEIDRVATECILRDHRERTFWNYIEDNLVLFFILIVVIMAGIVLMLQHIILTISRKNKKINEMLYSDDVTDGMSFLGFQERMMEFPGKAEKYYMISVDINGFKYINDMFGYDAGDSVLQYVLDFVQEFCGMNPCARVYADHFAGVCSYQEKPYFEKYLTGKLEEFDRKCGNDYPEFNAFLKIGIYTWRTGEKKELRRIINSASYAMDDIQNMSQSKYQFYTLQMHDEILVRKEIESDMHRAMKEGEFVAYYQPKFDVTTDTIVGAEALVRWQHKTKGLISPGEFIPIFEENQFIIEVDFCIYEQVCQLLRERMDRGEQLYPISCNFSRHHFQMDTFLGRLMKVLEKYQVPAQYIEIEITETIATSDFDRLLETVKALKEKGFLISIDDFGSGYSCVQLLYKLPIDTLKMDRVFAWHQNENKKEEAINRSLITICHQNNIKVICEGVENQEQKNFIMNYDCRYVQGFLYSKPVTRERFLQMLQEDAAKRH